MENDSKDLIERLLKLDPHERLGAGDDGDVNDMAALKNHEFFKQKTFKKAHRKRPPVGKKLLHKINDEWNFIHGSDDDGEVKDFDDENSPSKQIEKQ